MFGMTNQSQIDKLMVTLFLGLFFTFGSAFAESTINTGNGQGHTGSNPRDVQTCRGKVPTSRRTAVYNFRNGSTLSYFYPQGTELQFTSVVGNWAEIRWKTGSGTIHKGYVRKASFSDHDWQMARARCIGDARHLYEDRNPNYRQPDKGLYSKDRTEPNASQSIRQAGIACEFGKMQQFYRQKNRRERYAVINKPVSNPRRFRSYVVDMRTGRIVDNFDSLMGYNGIGCGTGQTRPGIFKIGSQSGKGASRKPWWGNNWRYQVIQNIGGHSTEYHGRKRSCGVYYQHVAHSNKNMSERNIGGSRYSAGCFVTSPQKFTQWTQAQAGNMLIYNVPKGFCTKN